jgi:VanZ family protein
LVRLRVWWFGFLATLFVGVVSTYLAYQSGLPAIVYEIDQLDKVIHFGMGGALAFFLDPILKRRAVLNGKLPLAAVLILVPAGIEEFLQRYSPNRSSSIWDFLADAAGVTAGIWISRWIDRWAANRAAAG